MFANAARLIHELPEVEARGAAELPDHLRLASDGDLSVYYAPFDAVNSAALVAVVGVTPGWHQTRIAYRVAATAIRGGAPAKAACVEAKSAASFAGHMRKNLVSMLDEIGVHEPLGLSSSESLFAEAASLLHTTSVLRYPVFQSGRNYSGHNPSPTRHPILRQMLDELLAPELKSMPSALVVPLGKAVAVALDWLETRGILVVGHRLTGFPHPSGANGYRVQQFESRKPDLRAAVVSWGCTLARAAQQADAAGRPPAGR